ncbi:hypothetical protein H0H92_015473 [Tricholoma furcatifolium]|nr:hypothetical protein H0H92_015473 [Tricholoma furcatifolium]
MCPSFARIASVLTILNVCVPSIASTLPSGVLFPLYIYPGTDCTGWNPLLSAISTYTTISFISIIDPNSGPGGMPGSQPDANYQNCVAQLRATGEASGGNVKLLGYVHTSYGTRALSDVHGDIDTYAGWNEAYRPDGIFFDEASTNENVVETYQEYAGYAKASLGNAAFITLNPGVWGSDSSAEYFSIADLIVTFENTYANFNASVIPDSAATPLSQQAALVHTGPTDVPIATVNILVTLAASFYTDFDAAEAYENFPTNWTGYLDALVSAQAHHTDDSSLETRTPPSLAEHVQRLPTEVKTMIGDQMYENAKNGAERARFRAAGVPQSGASRQQTAARVAHSRYQGGVNAEINNGQPRRAGEGLRAILGNNRRLRRSAIYDSSSLEARTGDDTLQENVKKLPNELKIKVGDQMYEGAKSKSATARFREAGVPQSEASRQKIKAVKAHEKLQKGVNDEVRNGNLPNASQGLRRIVTGNRRLRRTFDEEDLELVLRDIVDGYYANHL